MTVEHRAESVHPPAGAGAQRTDARLTLALAASLTASALVLWLPSVDLHLWLDEVITLAIAEQPIPDIVRLLELDGSPPLYYLIAHLWQAIFGTSEVALRMLPFLIGLAATVLGAAAVATREGFRVGATFGALAVVTPGVLYYATEARQYSLLFALGLLTSVLLRDEIADPRLRRRLLLAGALALVCYTHNWGVFLWAGTMAAMLAASTTSLRERLVAIGQTSALTAALFLPWLAVLLRQTATTGAPWLAPPNGTDVVLSDLAWLFGAREYVILAFVLVAVGRFSVARRTYDALLVQVMVTMLSGWAFSMVVAPAFTARYLMIVLPGILLMLALAVADNRYLAACVVAVGVLMALHSVVILSGRPDDYKSRAMEIAGLIDEHRNAGDRVAVVAAETSLPSVAHYLADDLSVGVRYVSFRGVVDDPRIVDWRNATEVMRTWRAEDTLPGVLAESDVIILLAERVAPSGDRATDYWRAYDHALDRAASVLDTEPRLALREALTEFEWEIRVYEVKP